MESVRSVERAASLIEIIGAHNARGARLVDIVSESSLQKTTVARIIATLVGLGLVDVDPVTERFHLGFSMVSLGMLASARYGLVQLAHRGMARIATETQDTVHLVVRAGKSAVCVDVIRGTWPIRTLTLDVGDRRPLGVGSASLAILAALPDHEVDTLIEENTGEYEAWPKISTDKVRRLVDQSRAQGYSFIDELLLPGVRGVSAPILTSGGKPIASISVSAVTGRLEEERRESVARLLSEEAGAISAALDNATQLLPIEVTNRWLLKSPGSGLEHLADV